MAASVEEYDEHDASAPENLDTHEEQLQNDHSGGIAEKRWPGWPGESVFRMLVPTHKVGGVIGRKGEFIKKMCEETKARIKILDGPPGTQERAVLISAKEEPDSSLPPAVDALLRVHKRAADGLDADSSNARPNPGGPISSRLLVGATQAGSLIGKQGATIKSIQEASNCVIRVLGQDDLPVFALQDDRIVEIQGEPSGVHKAVELIASHLRKFLVDRSVIGLFEMHMQNPPPPMDHNMPPHQPWGPQGYGPPNAGGGPGYGPPNSGGGPGYGPPNSGGGPGYGPHVGGGGPGYGPPNTSGGPGYGPQYPSGGPGYGPQPTGGAPGFGPSPQYGMPSRQHDNYYPPADLPPMDKQPIQGLSMYGRDASMGPHSSASAQPPQSITSQITQHMQVPLSYADAVIGNAGANISYIRRASGATITIQETRGVPGEMTVEINGTGSQVQAAQQLIKNSMAEAASSQQNAANGPPDNSYAPHPSVYQSPPSNNAPNPGSYGSNYNGSYGNNYGTNYGY